MSDADDLIALIYGQGFKTGADLTGHGTTVHSVMMT
jgi:hypothetical protein